MRLAAYGGRGLLTQNGLIHYESGTLTRLSYLGMEKG
jgi:hypothetical protein